MLGPIVLFAILITSPLASAEHVSAGVIGGAGLTNDFQSATIPADGSSPYFAFYSHSKDYVAGGLIELKLPLHLSVEADALYRPLNYAYSFSYTNPSGTGGSSHPSVAVITWEFPVLAKYRIPMRIIKPFFEAGPSFRAASNLNATSPSNHGASAGAGIEVAFHRLKKRRGFATPAGGRSLIEALGVDSAKSSGNPGRPVLLVLLLLLPNPL
jgi:hypothetical protein